MCAFFFSSHDDEVEGCAMLSGHRSHALVERRMHHDCIGLGASCGLGSPRKPATGGGSVRGTEKCEMPTVASPGEVRNSR